MRRHATACALAGLLIAMSGPTLAATEESVPVYTSEDLDRMLGPVPAGPSEPVDRSSPQDWIWVEQFLDRQYARIDADRQHDLDRRTIDIAERRTRPLVPYYGGVAWSLGYPASTWWSGVYGHYAHALAQPYHDHDAGSAHGRGHRR